MRIATCQKCQTRIVMAKHIRTRKAAPIEVEPSNDGNILVTGDTYEIVKAEEREMVKRRGFVLRKNHFATCEFAKSFSHQEQAKALPANVVRFPRGGQRR